MVSPGSSFPPNPFHLPFTTLDPHLTSQSKLLYEMRFVDKNIYLSSFEVFGTFFSTNQKGRSFSALLSTGFCSTSVYSTLWLRLNFIFYKTHTLIFFKAHWLLFHLSLNFFSVTWWWRWLYLPWQSPSSSFPAAPPQPFLWRPGWTLLCGSCLKLQICINVPRFVEKIQWCGLRSLTTHNFFFICWTSIKIFSLKCSIGTTLMKKFQLIY